MADMEKENSGEIDIEGGTEENVKASEAAAPENGSEAEKAEEPLDTETDEAQDSDDAEDVESGEGSEGEEEKLSWAEKRAARKQAKTDKKEEAFKEQIEQLEDRVKRQMAEFENFRKRTEKEKQAMFDMGAKSVLEKILPVVDNFERGFQTVKPENAEDPFVDGMNRVYKQLLTELENIGVKPIEALGCEFDPNLHNAVMQVESEEYETGVVAQELQKGYTYHDTVIRHSVVAVVE